MTNTQTLYCVNAKEEDNEYWRDKVLKPIVEWERLLKEKEIKRSGCYYPRLAETTKRGINAFNEVYKAFFKDINKEFLLALCRFNITPQINNFNSLTLTYVGKGNHFEKYFKDEGIKLITSYKPFDAIVNNLNIMSSREKVKTVKDMIENLEYSPLEYSMLMCQISADLIDYHQETT